MTSIYFEDVTHIGPDGQTQDGICAIYTDRKDAEVCAALLREEYKGCEFRLLDDDVPIDAPYQKVIDSLRGAP